MKLDLKKTAVLSLDVQAGIIGMVTGAQAAMPQVAQVVTAARGTGCSLIHVGLGFESGYPEVGPKGRFAMLKEKGLFMKGSESAQIDPLIYRTGDLVVHKKRVSAFAGNGLDMILRSQGIETLVLFGFSTSGIVLSTLRQASDLDYMCIVIKDACFDRDEEVHRVLTEKIFASQATVIIAKEFADLCQ